MRLNKCKLQTQSSNFSRHKMKHNCDKKISPSSRNYEGARNETSLKFLLLLGDIELDHFPWSRLIRNRTAEVDASEFLPACGQNTWHDGQLIWKSIKELFPSLISKCCQSFAFEMMPWHRKWIQEIDFYIPRLNDFWRREREKHTLSIRFIMNSRIPETDEASFWPCGN